MSRSCLAVLLALAGTLPAADPPKISDPVVAKRVEAVDGRVEIEVADLVGFLGM